jgi:ACR3 family arsenite efflux pump ArsB
MLGALGLFVLERGREMGSAPEFLNGVGIILVGIAVNAACVLVLVQIKRADNKLVPPPKK